jgi:hypothetical protein
MQELPLLERYRPRMHDPIPHSRVNRPRGISAHTHSPPMCRTFLRALVAFLLWPLDCTRCVGGAEDYCTHHEQHVHLVGRCDR